MLIYSIIVTLAILIWLLLTAYADWRRRRAGNAPALPDMLPSVSIVVAALNEEETIESAMRSLLALDYPHLEIIAVDDRSTDRTGEILDRLSEESGGRLRTIHITRLPDGWLGKCHALATAARHLRSDWILFTDADVIFEPQALRTAIAFATAHRADHIILFPWMLWHGYVEAALLTLFAISLRLGFQIWRIESKSLRAFAGIGAFNMIRRELYERFGGHEPLRLEVADDMKLGYLAKKHGGRSMSVDSEGEVRVRWRNGARDIVRGIERSGFAGVNFSWGRTVMIALFYIGVLLAPYALLILSPSSLITWLSIASLTMLLVMYAITARTGRLPLWIGLLHPVACILFVWAMLRSAIVTTVHGGLRWRGTFYSIQALKRGSVR
jgi:cellulose synthase/poly-beta-1,6-N-acetylglucosamine synthase-like glycosyltransferase